MNRIATFLVFLLIPFLIFLFLAKTYADNIDIKRFDVYTDKINYNELKSVGVTINKPTINIKELTNKMINIQRVVYEFNEFYKEFSKTVDSSIISSKEQKTLSEDLYE